MEGMVGAAALPWHEVQAEPAWAACENLMLELRAGGVMRGCGVTARQLV
jgi:hypothetical protein